MVRHQGLDRITWTYDPLQSRNAYLNIAKLGAVCDTYLPEYYGEMRDGVNIGVPSDRFQVDWWVNSQRVKTRLSRKARRKLDLAHYFAAEIEVINPTQMDGSGWPSPNPRQYPTVRDASLKAKIAKGDSMVLVEIPPDYKRLKDANPNLAVDWRLHTRMVFQDLFENGYLVTDFVYLRGTQPRSYYVLSHGESTL
jgi:predicted GNAT superfamily acetyltransferase